MVISRVTKIIGGTIGTGLIALGCYHSARLYRERFDESQRDDAVVDNTPDDSSNRSEMSFTPAHFQRAIRIGLTAGTLVRYLYNRINQEHDDLPPYGEANEPPQMNANEIEVQRYDPGGGGDSGINTPNQPRREETGSGDAPQYVHPIQVWGVDAPPPF